MTPGLIPALLTTRSQEKIPASAAFVVVTVPATPPIATVVWCERRGSYAVLRSRIRRTALPTRSEPPKIDPTGTPSGSL